MSQRTRPRARARRLVAPLMLLLFASGVACVRTATAPAGPDPLHTDGDKYQLVFDNRLLRVLRYHDEPGAITHLHHHPCFVLVALSAFERELTFADGHRARRSFQAGEAAWMPAQSHAGHNTGDTPTDVLLIEMKGPCA